MHPSAVEFAVESVVREKATYFLSMNSMYYAWIMNNIHAVTHMVIDLNTDIDDFCDVTCPQSAVCRNSTTMRLTTNPRTPHYKELSKRVLQTLLMMVDTFETLTRSPGVFMPTSGAMVPPVVPAGHPVPDPAAPVYVLSPEEQILLHAIKQNGKISAENAASLLKVSRAKAKKILQILVDREMLQVIEEDGVKYYSEIA